MKDQHLLFCNEYVKDFNATRSYLVAYPNSASDSARSSACDLVAQPSIRTYVDTLIEQRIAETGIEAADVVRKLWATITADPNELIEMRRECCRYCYGVDYKYQYTAGEWDRAIYQWEQDSYEAERDNRRALNKPCTRGGLGFHRSMPPNPACPECFGEGIEREFVKDTRNLSPAARELYAGVKVTKGGIEIQKHSRDKAIELIGRHLAMFTDNVDHKNNGGSFEPMSLADFYDKPSTDTESGSS